jgi:hypothetical protein
MPALTFQEAKARVLGAERANEPVRKGSKEYNEIMNLMKINGHMSIGEILELQKGEELPKVELNLKDSKTVNPLRRPDLILPDKKPITKEEFLSVECNRNAFRDQLFRQKHLRNL